MYYPLVAGYLRCRGDLPEAGGQPLLEGRVSHHVRRVADTCFLVGPNLAFQLLWIRILLSFLEGGWTEPGSVFCQGSDPRVRSHPVNFNPSYKDLTEKMFRERDRY